MSLQGFGMGLTFTPVMTAAFRALRPDQVNDASAAPLATEMEGSADSDRSEGRRRY
jgi:hypothetical protein